MELTERLQRLALTSLICLTTFCQAAVYADDSVEPVFVDAVFIEGSDLGSSFYPGGEASMARTARAWASFMVGKDGKTFAPMIEQINNQRVRGAVIKRIEALEYKPATLNGLPVDSFIRQPFRFNMGYEARSRFVSTKLFNKHLKAFNTEFAKESPNAKKLQKSINKLNGTRHGHHIAYEYISAARYKYASLFEDRESQIYAIREMLLSNDGGLASIDDEIADKRLIQLLIEAGYYGQALQAYFDARRKHRGPTGDALENLFGEAISQIGEIVSSDKAFARAVIIRDQGYMFLPLMKPAFAFEQVQGEFDRLKLRCQYKYAELPFTPDSDYKIPEEWGACQLQVTGDAGATAQIIQFQ